MDQINIKNRTYYSFNDIINIEDFDWNLLKIDSKSYTNVNIYYTGYITITNFDYVRIVSVNSLSIIFEKADEYVEENNANRYLNFASRYKNKEVLIKYAEIWDEIKYLNKTINGGEVGEYGKEYTKIKLNSDDNLPLNKVVINDSFSRRQQILSTSFLRWMFVWVTDARIR